MSRGQNASYRPIDELLEDWCFAVLRVARHWDWMTVEDLVIALDVPSQDENEQRRDCFHTTISRLTARGHLERRGRTMAFSYRITESGRAEYRRQLERNAV